ncbi:MAG: hypothetical protein KDB60_09605 [Propionibacteriaceae bacterium]|nr:hypothetical protein [Propionibacteriaceae bacterium]
MSDRVRQVVVTASAVFMVVGTLFGIGLIGTPVENSAGGSLSATATLLAPAVRAFSIWSVIYAGLIAYVVWQWLPSNATSPRARRIGALSAVSMVLNGAWLLVTQAGWLWASVVVILGLAATLGELMRRLGRPTRAGSVEKLLVDGTFGLYLGWVSIATAANITAALVASGVNPRPEFAELWAVGVLAVAAVIGVLLARVLDGRLGVALAMSWGLFWIAFGRLAGEPSSALAGAAAGVAAAVVLTATGLIWLRRAGEPVLVQARHR